jgi:hypothetical protein
MQLLEGNGWLHSKSWQTVGRIGTTKHFHGNYLICDGGYHRWPCLIPPTKDAVLGSPHLKWSAKLESVRKDIVRFLKNFNNLHKQSHTDAAFATCCCRRMGTWTPILRHILEDSRKDSLNDLEERKVMTHCGIEETTIPCSFNRCNVATR